MFDPPPETRYNILSLGAGVQSSCLALMAAKGEVGPMPDAAIFADTGDEPREVYEWLEWLIGELPYPVKIVEAKKGRLSDNATRVRLAKNGRLYTQTDIPFFLTNKKGERGAIRQRGCTRDFKILPLEKEMRRLCEVPRGCKKPIVGCWIGISLDEVMRMKPSREKWKAHRWPLVDLRMRRSDCLEWMRRNGFPSPPRSACVFCPFHNDATWRKMKRDAPAEFQWAVDFEKRVQQSKAEVNDIEKTPFLHRSCIPLDEVDFLTDYDRGQVDLFNNECEGMCGV